MKLSHVEKEVKRFSGLQKMLISFICILLFLGVVTVFKGESAWSKSGYDAFTMLRYSILDHPIEVISDWMEDLAYLRGVQEENEQLQNILASQDMYKAELDEKNRKIEELETLMKFNSNANYTKEYASVVYRDMNTWSNTITVNKGKKDGIQEDMAVITYEGLVGKVSDVYENTCKVKLLSTENKDVSVAIQIELSDTSTTAGILENYNGVEGTYHVQVFDNNVEIKEGMNVITSGTGGVFPSGILVGKVDSVTKLYNSKGRIVAVIPSVNFNDFDYVAILKVK